jgi:myo-inositol-1(or 4)-monophosphatase
VSGEWLARCRAAAKDVDAVLAELPRREDRDAVLGRGEGGDDTTVVDARAEAAVLGHFEDVSVVSEEVGEIERGTTVAVIDPIDGSINAKRLIPFFSLSIAIADGRTMDDVHFGYVFDFGSREEWWAVRGEGAFLNGAPLQGRPGERIELLAFEATKTDLIAQRVGAMVGLAERLRVLGSLALSLCQLAAGRVDAVCSLREARSVDIAAGQLLVRERGLAIDLFEDPPFGAAPLDLRGRSRVVAAGTDALCAELAQALA